MLPTYPVNPMKGRGAVRVPVNCWYTNDKERVLLVSQFRPYHHIKTRGKHYLSPEASRSTIADLRMLQKQVEFNNAMVEKPSQFAQFLKDVQKLTLKYQEKQ